MSQAQTPSLVNRLAGPSVGKAGLVKDQTEINKIIAEVSKGSKFYENEKRKDKELTAKIEQLLRERDEVMKGADVGKLEAYVDRLVRDMEANRDLSQHVVHIDMDAFYANVEVLDNPTLAGKAFGVGGLLTTASYEARKYGVRSGQPGFIAKKLCPHIILVPLRHGRYSEMSRKVMAVLEEYDPNMSIMSPDEAYLNITNHCDTQGVSPEDCVEEMRQKVFETTGLTASAGIAPNRLLAKICSDRNKPNGQFLMPFDAQRIKDFMRELPIRKVPGIGGVAERLLSSIDIKICGDIYVQRATLALMDKQFGLEYLLHAFLGLGSNVVEPGDRSSRKSVGSERTFAPIKDKVQIIAKLEAIAKELEDDLTRTGWTGKTVTLKYKLDTYRCYTRAKSCDRYVSSQAELFAIGKELLLPELPLTVRLLGLRVTNLKDLRVKEDTGIKRFFPSAGELSLPKKRRKLNNNGTAEVDVEIIDTADNSEGRDPPSTTVLSQERSRTASPTRSQKQAAIDRQLSLPPAPRLTPLLSPSRPGAHSLAEKLQCPVCSKFLQTDNAGLNEHVDFCLSRGLIMQASASASGSSASSSKSGQQQMATKAKKKYIHPLFKT